MRSMKFKRVLAVLLAASVMLLGCAKEEGPKESANNDSQIADWEPIPEPVEPTEAPEVIEEEEEETEVIPEGCYRSELTNEWIDEALMNQRPIAVMIDNEKTALNHFGVNSADIVYEIMNSTANDRITRLMVIVKDYEKVEQLGSVRSTRPTNFMLAAEYNAILIHDGGPEVYNNQYYAKAYVNNLSGGFARFNNGKAREFTEYVTPEEYVAGNGKKYDGLLKRIEDAGYSREYNEYYEGPHFTFSDEEYFLDEMPGVISATEISLPFFHNESKLIYNEETGTYDYYEYGGPHIDELDGKVTTFKNVILQGCTFSQLDANGYLIYNVIGSGLNGFYLTNGKAIPIYWMKDGETAITHFMTLEDSKDIVLNTGKTYIAVVPDDTWDQVEIN